MQSNTAGNPRHAVAVHGTALGADLRNRLREVGYTPAAVAEIVEHIGTVGTARGSVADAEDVEHLNDLVRRATAHVEYDDPSEMPAAWDEGYWTPDNPDPFEPTEADRAEWAAMTDPDALTPAEALDVEAAYERAMHLADELTVGPADASEFAERQAGARRDEILARRPRGGAGG